MNVAARVGLATIAVILIIIYAMAIFGKLGTSQKGDRYYVNFTNVGGLSTGSLVRVSGMTVGKVLDLAPTNTQSVKVTFLITRPDVQIRKNSIITISASMMGDTFLDITPVGGPVAPPGSQLEGESPVSLYALLLQGDNMMKSIQQVTDNLNDILGDENSRKNLKESIANLEGITANLKNFSESLNENVNNVSDRLAGLVDNLNGEVSGVGSNLRGFSGSLKNMAITNEGDIRSIVENLKETSISLKKTLKTIETLVTQQKFSDDIMTTLENVRKTSEEVSGIAEDVHMLTSDPKMKEDLKQTVSNAKEVTEGAKDVVKRLKYLLGAGKPEAGQGRLLELQAENEWQEKNGQSNPNLNLHVLRGCPTSVMVGVDSVGYDNKLNLQVRKGGKAINPRVGVIRSNFGVGAESDIGNLNVSCDLYNPRNVQVDLLGRYTLPGEFYLMGGVRDAFDDRNTVFGVGKRF
ncbi:MAG: MlaD family protein [Chloroflexi bacterium]|nr:MlaD family protein [Chloroflexota bacterium]